MPAQLLSLAALFLLWFGFSGALSLAELVAAILATGIALAGYAVVRRRAVIPRGQHLGWYVQAARAWPVRIARDAVKVFGAVPTAHARNGRFRQLAVPDPRDQARLAWSILAISISPNCYVVGWDEDAEFLLIHELVPSRGDRDDAMWWPR